MIVSPSVASGDILNIQKEVEYINQNFKELHLDIEDGNAVHSISFGFKMARNIIAISDVDVSMHLEIIDPLRFKEEIKSCNAKIIFIQVDCLKEPIPVLKELSEYGIPVGVNISNLDMERPELEEMLSMYDDILVNTTHHDDRQQICDPIMLDYAIKLAESKKVWIDGGITEEIYRKVKDSKIYAAVMGRAIFSDRDKAKDIFC